MRIIYFILILIVWLLTLIAIFGELIDKNLYQKYGKVIFRILMGIIMLICIMYLCMIFLGLSDAV